MGVEHVCQSDAPLGWVRVWSAASVLGISRQRVHQLIAEGRFGRVAVRGRDIFVRNDALVRFKKLKRDAAFRYR